MLVSFADYPHNICKTILKEQIASAWEKRIDIRKQKRLGAREQANSQKLYFWYKLDIDAGKESKCLHPFFPESLLYW